MQKAQITIFIILGLIVLIIFGITIFILTRIIGKVPEEIKPEIPILTEESIKSFVAACLAPIATKAIYLVAAQSGYVHPSGSPEHGEPGDGKPAKFHYFLGPATILSYAIIGNENRLRSLSQIEDVLAKYTIVELGKCLNFTEYVKQGFEISWPNIDFSAFNFEYEKINLNYTNLKPRFSVSRSLIKYIFGSYFRKIRIRN